MYIKCERVCSQVHDGPCLCVYLSIGAAKGDAFKKEKRPAAGSSGPSLKKTPNWFLITFHVRLPASSLGAQLRVVNRLIMTSFRF